MSAICSRPSYQSLPAFWTAPLFVDLLLDLELGALLTPESVCQVPEGLAGFLDAVQVPRVLGQLRNFSMFFFFVFLFFFFKPNYTMAEAGVREERKAEGSGWPRRML